MDNKHIKIPGLPDNLENYLSSLVFHLGLPLLPLFLEFWQSGKVSENSLTIVASLYSISIGVSSESKFLFSITIVIGIIFAFAHGFGLAATSKLPQVPNCKYFAITTIILVSVAHAGERWNIHMSNEEPYLTFK